MLDRKREEILAWRKKREEGNILKSASSQLTDAYIRRVIRNSSGGSLINITSELIIETRERIKLKRKLHGRPIQQKVKNYPRKGTKEAHRPSSEWGA